MSLLDRLLHRIPWSGDKIRLYNRNVKPIDTFVGEFFLKMVDGNVLVQDGSGRNYIRGDLPKWSTRHSCWEYWYNGGE